MLAFSAFDWAVNAIIAAMWVAAVFAVVVADRASARNWSTLQDGIRQTLGLRNSQEAASAAAGHAADASASYERARGAVAVAEQAYEDVLRIRRDANTSC